MGVLLLIGNVVMSDIVCVFLVILELVIVGIVFGVVIGILLGVWVVVWCGWVVD